MLRQVIGFGLQFGIAQLHFLVHDRERIVDGLETSATPEGVVLDLPATAPDPISSTIVLKPRQSWGRTSRTCRTQAR